MHFADSIIIFLIALVLFGPKRLPEIGRQIGKLLAEFRRASNEFKLQIDDELRTMEQQDRQKKLEAATQAAALPSPESAAEPTILPPTIAPPSTGEPVSAASPYSPATPPELPVPVIEGAVPVVEEAIQVETGSNGHAAISDTAELKAPEHENVQAHLNG
jgi:TatA/E family protein of Tat protein translocase